MLIFGAVFLVSCKKDKDDNGVAPDDVYGSEFLVYYWPRSDGAYGSDHGLFKVTPKDGEAVIERLNSIYPDYAHRNTITVNKEHVALIASLESLPENAPEHSRLVYFNMNNPGEVKVIAPPDSPSKADFRWEVQNAKPFVLKDGRIVAKLSYREFSGISWGMWAYAYMGIYNPVTEQWTISEEDADAFVLAQPEQGWDTEGGYIVSDKGTMTPDESKVIITMVGHGVHGGVIHSDHEFIVYYDIENNSFGRIMEGKHTIYGASNKSVYFRQDGMMKAIDISTKNIIDIDEFFGDLTSPRERDEYIRVGNRQVSTYAKSGNTFIEKNIINSSKLVNRTYQVLSTKASYVNNEQEIIFVAHKSLDWNYRADFAVYKTPIVEENPDPELLFELSKEFYYRVWVLK